MCVFKEILWLCKLLTRFFSGKEQVSKAEEQKHNKQKYFDGNGNANATKINILITISSFCVGVYA